MLIFLIIVMTKVKISVVDFAGPVQAQEKSVASIIRLRDQKSMPNDFRVSDRPPSNCNAKRGFCF